MANTPYSNDIKTSSLATLVAIRAAENAGYFTVGSKKYFAGQLEGKRNGQTYRFVLKDSGEAVNRLSVYSGDNRSTGTRDDMSINEREVALKLEPWHIAVETNSIEAITDMDWDKEIAEPNAQKLMSAAVKAQINKDFGKCGVAFVGSGFAPLSQASAHLASVTNEELYGFVDPNIEAILTSNGQQFVPVNAPDMYSKGLLGKFHGAEYRAQRFLPNVVISQDLVDEFDAGVTVTSFVPYAGTDEALKGTATLTLSGVTEVIKKGTPIWIEGVMACDTLGEATSQEKAFIALADAQNGVVTVADVDNSGKGTRDVAAEDGTAAIFAGQKASIPEAGKYFGGIVRANGAMEFETLEKLDAAGADYAKESVEGVTVHQNKMVDLEMMTNITRFDTVILAGVVDPRAQAYFLVR